MVLSTAVNAQCSESSPVEYYSPATDASPSYGYTPLYNCSDTVMCQTVYGRQSLEYVFARLKACPEVTPDKSILRVFSVLATGRNISLSQNGSLQLMLVTCDHLAQKALAWNLQEKKK